ncbi:MAG: cation-translocating P-type ATPase [Gemmatimonadaceae bacterium]
MSDTMVVPASTAADAPSPPWYNSSGEDVLARVHASGDGLSAPEAARRLAADGPNALTEGTQISPWRILLAQLKSVIIWVLIVAGVISGVLGDAIDAIAILAIVVLNAAIGFYQEYSAERSIAALKEMTAPHARVRRDQEVVSIAASDVVVGDMLELEAGDLVAADARLLHADSLTVTESALTGESETVSKHSDILLAPEVPLGDRQNMIFMGTSVATGTGQAVVVATGMNTELGHIAGLLDSAQSDDDTPLQHKLDSFGRILVWVALAIVALLFGLGLLRGTPPLEMLLTSISLAVAAVPEGLPAVVTVALSLGVLRMARRRALIRKLAAVETLGSTSVICTDKTGTLTVGQMTARVLYVAGQHYDVTGEGYSPDGEVRAGDKPVEPAHIAPLLELATIIVGCNNAHLTQKDGVWSVVGDPTEGALLVAGAKAGADRQRIDREMPLKNSIPFDSDRKRSAMIRQMSDGRLRALVNGAPGPLLERCTHVYGASGIAPMTEQDRREILAQTSAMATSALRVLASALRDLDAGVEDFSADAIERDLVFVGLTGMYDPPRPAARSAIDTCRTAGIRVVMITGDHAQTAAAIARELGIASDDVAVTGANLDAMTDDVLRVRVPGVGVYARVTAAHKLRIIRALQANGDIVAMTGDGVNDAPAIKGADIGIAMGIAGTEVTKQAADMIITDDHFATIVAAVEEGRGIYDNIRKTLQYLLAGNTSELLLMTVCVAIGLPAPLLPIHLLWINLVTDGLPALCLATDPIDHDLMTRRPRARTERITDRAFLRTMVFTGVLTAGVAFAVYLFMLRGASTDVARSYAFAVLVFAELLRSFGARSETKPVWRISLFTNVNLVVVVVASIGLQLWSQHSEILGGFLKTERVSFVDGLALLALGALPLTVLEIAKVVRSRSRA